MDLLEIRLAVANHLDFSDLAVCAQVCKEWHQTFVPFLYEKLALHPFSDYKHYLPRDEYEDYLLDKEYASENSSDDEAEIVIGDKAYAQGLEQAKRPPAPALLRYGNLVRDLDLVLPVPLLHCLAGSAREIRTLTVQAPKRPYYMGESDTEEDEEWTLFERKKVDQLLARNHRLQHLDLCYFDRPETLRHFDVLIKKASCQNLEELWLEELTFTLVKMVALLQSCPRLSRLIVINCVLTSDGDEELFPEGVSVFPRIEQLELEHNNGLSLTGELNWIAHCPSLRELSWIPKKSMWYDATVDMSPLYQCPHLSSLTLGVADLDDTELASVFSNCPKLTDLTLMGGWMSVWRLDESIWETDKFGSRHVPSRESDALAHPSILSQSCGILGVCLGGPSRDCRRTTITPFSSSHFHWSILSSSRRYSVKFGLLGLC